VREELQILLSDKPIADRKRSEREAVEAYISDFTKKMDALQTEYGLTYRASLQVTASGIIPVVRLTPFDPSKLESEKK